MVIAQHKAVRHQIVACVDQRIGLADRAVAGIFHLRHPQPEFLGRGGPPEEGETLRQHEPEIDRQQGLELAGCGLCWIFADAEDPAECRGIGIAHFDGFRAEDRARAVERTAEMAAHDRDAAVATRHHHVGHFHRFGEHQAAMLIYGAAARLAP